MSKGDLDCELLEDRMVIKFICVTQEFAFGGHSMNVR